MNYFEDIITDPSLFRAKYFDPSKSCVVGIGCTSAELAEAVEKARPTFQDNIDFVETENEKPEIVSQWTGGIGKGIYQIYSSIVDFSNRTK